MSSVWRNSNKRAASTIFYKQKMAGANIFSLCAFLVFLTLATLSRVALASSGIKEPARMQHAKFSYTTEAITDAFQVQWTAPKFVKLINKTHGRFLIAGKTAPGIIIRLEPNAVWIDPPMKTGNLTINDMSPNRTEITIQRDGRFKFLVTLPFAYVQLPFSAKSPRLVSIASSVARQNAKSVNGRSPASVESDPSVQHYILSMKISKPPPIKASILKTASRWKFGLDARSVAYSQTNLSSLNETMLAFDVLYERTLAKRWLFRAQSFIDLAGDAPLATNENEGSARFWNSNADVIYAFPHEARTWAFGIAGGVFYTSMYPQGINFGFRNLWGPELYPIATYLLNNKNSLDFYLKYSPVFSQTPVNFGSHELDAGVEWTRDLTDKRSVSYKLELLQDVLKGDGASAQSTAVNLGVSLWLP